MDTGRILVDKLAAAGFLVTGPEVPRDVANQVSTSGVDDVADVLDNVWCIFSGCPCGHTVLRERRTGVFKQFY